MLDHKKESWRNLRLLFFAHFGVKNLGKAHFYLGFYEKIIFESGQKPTFSGQKPTFKNKSGQRICEIFVKKHQKMAKNRQKRPKNGYFWSFLLLFCNF